MKQKKYFILAAAAILMAACSENDIAEKQSPQVTADADAVDFDVYTSRGTTRAVGQSGVINTENLKSGTAGFGVFGYYTNSERYSGITKPNFFYNQNVTYGGSRWEYTPVKYWPNEFGTDAISDQVDRVTFFAYAPWVNVDPLTGVVKKGTVDTDDFATTNIISITRNNVTGDPYIRYSASMDPLNCTDLLYGVAAENFTSSNSSVNVNNIEKGKPYKDVVKPGTDANSKIKFDFKHALAQLRVYIDANVVDMTNGNISETVDDSHTRIWVRSVTFEGITKEGSLNLNSIAPDAQWYDINGVNKITTGSLAVYDGLKDGREPLEKATTESPATFNTDLIQSKKYKITSGSIDATGGFPKGVTQVEKPLFQGGETVFAIPTGEKMKVTIVYDVETVDPNLAFYLSDGETQGSTIENKISKTIETFGSIKSGYCYTLKLHLGMRTVDFDAKVTDWLNDGADVDLPSNLQTFAAKPAADDARGTINLPWDVTSYDFAVSGLKVNSTASFGTAPSLIAIGTKTFTPVNSAGVSKVSLSSITPNNTINNITEEWVIGDGGTNQVTLTATQYAAPLGVKINSVTGNTIKLAKNNGSNWDVILTDVTKKDQIIVSRNGQEMEGVVGTAAPLADNVAIIDNNTNKTTTLDIYFKNEFIAGDVITVWIKGGHAPEETAKINIGGLSYAANSYAIPYQSVAHDPILPNLIGPGSNVASNYDWSEGVTTYYDVASDGTITTTALGTSTVTATLNSTYTTNAGKLGWYFPLTKHQSATFNLTVTKQKATMEFTSTNTTSATSFAYTAEVGSYSGEFETVTGTTTPSYSLISQSTNNAVYVINSSTGVVTVESGTAQSGDKFIVKATATNDLFEFAPVEMTVSVTP
jgi:hypothetical protein